MKRPNGEGQIYQRGSDKKWIAALWIDGHLRTRTCKTKREAVIKLRELKDLRDRGQAAIEGRQPLGEWLEEWLAEKATVVRASSYDDYRCHVDRIKSEIGNIRLDELRPAHVSRMDMALLRRRGYRGGPLSPTTVHSTHIVLSSALKTAVRRGMIPQNVATAVPAPKPREVERRTLAPSEVRAVIADLEENQPHVAPLFVVLVTTGIRIGEAGALRWRDVHLDGPDPRIDIAHNLTRNPDGGRRLGPTKTRKSQRPVYLTDLAVSALLTQKRRVIPEMKLAAWGWQDNDLVFPSARGGYLIHTTVTDQIARAYARLGIERLTLHALRHTAATLLVAAGEHVGAVSEMLGHADHATTQNIYAHASPALHRRAAATMDRLLKEG